MAHRFIGRDSYLTGKLFCQTLEGAAGRGDAAATIMVRAAAFLPFSEDHEPSSGLSTSSSLPQNPAQPVSDNPFFARIEVVRSEHEAVLARVYFDGGLAVA